MSVLFSKPTNQKPCSRGQEANNEKRHARTFRFDVNGESGLEDHEQGSDHSEYASDFTKHDLEHHRSRLWQCSRMIATRSASGMGNQS